VTGAGPAEVDSAFHPSTTWTFDLRYDTLKADFSHPSMQAFLGHEAIAA
jgi:hypothetical protein